MRQLALTTSAIAGHLRRAIGTLLTFFGPCWDGPDKKYHPEDHYMRGPGPKWREKNFLDRASTGGR
jgi:hypothetical protein